MTKTPEELTAEWKAGKLEADKEYYIKITDDIVIIDFYTQQYDNSHYPLGLGFDLSSNKFIKKILAPVPTYDEYKAMQAELAEHRHYCCCSENEVMQLKLAEMEEKNKIWDELAENLLCLEEGNWENLVKNGTKEQRLDFLKRKEKYSLLAILDKYEQLKKELESARWYQTVQNEDIGKLRGLLKECKNIVAHDCWREAQFPDGQVVQKQDLLTRINATLGESEEK